MTLPNTILIGVQKAGTSSIYNWISQHPEVYGPQEIKDLHYFSLDKYFERGDSFLSSFYPNYNNEKIIMCGGVNYIYFPFVAKRINTFNPDAKLILILRNPVKRAYSAYTYFYKLGVENRSFTDAISFEKNTQFEDIIDQSTFTYLEHGKYYQQIQEYYNIFNPDQIKILLYEEVIKDHENAMRELFEFLEVSTSFQINPETINKTGSPLFRPINKFLFGNTKLKSFVKKILFFDKLPVSKRIYLADLIKELNTKRNRGNTLSLDEYNKLNNYFTEDIKLLSSLLNRDLSSVWNYEN